VLKLSAFLVGTLKTKDKFAGGVQNLMGAAVNQFKVFFCPLLFCKIVNKYTLSKGAKTDCIFFFFLRN
jgi:hypothetical protein